MTKSMTITIGYEMSEEERDRYLEMDSLSIDDFETENDAYAYAAEKKIGCGLGFEVEF